VSLFFSRSLGSKADVNLQQNTFCSRLLRAKTLTVSFKKPWEYLAETNRASRVAGDFSEGYSRWWTLLDKARTHFDADRS
jgi:hypothetical protein